MIWLVVGLMFIVIAFIVLLADWVEEDEEDS
jgi:hypothetical protein